MRDGTKVGLSVVGPGVGVRDGLAVVGDCVGLVLIGDAAVYYVVMVRSVNEMIFVSIQMSNDEE